MILSRSRYGYFSAFLDRLKIVASYAALNVLAFNDLEQSEKNERFISNWF